MKSKKRNKLISGVLPGVLAVLLAFLLLPARDEARETDSGLSVTFVDVGHGDAILVSNRGEHLLIDAGEGEGTEHLTELLRSRGVWKLNWLLISHEHSDHIGGVTTVMDNVDVNYILHSIEDPQDDMKQVRLQARKNGARVKEVGKGDMFQVGGAVATVLGPFEHSGDENNSSVVLRVDYGNTSFLFMGDAEEEEETDLLNADYDLSADVLKVGHHGGATSTSKKLLDAVEPDYAVNSAGGDEEEYPAQETIDRLENAGAEVHVTGRDGDITFVSDGDDVEIVW